VEAVAEFGGVEGTVVGYDDGAEELRVDVPVAPFEGAAVDGPAGAEVEVEGPVVGASSKSSRNGTAPAVDPLTGWFYQNELPDDLVLGEPFTAGSPSRLPLADADVAVARVGVAVVCVGVVVVWAGVAGVAGAWVDVARTIVTASGAS
jgi:hypothetical protein